MDAGEKKTLLILLGAGAVWFFFYSQIVGSAPSQADGNGATDSTILDEVYVMATGVPGYLDKWANAIQSYEGWFPGSRSYRNNNPGNLEISGDLGRDSGGYGMFSTYDKGRAALIADLSAKVRKYASWSLYDVMARYAPPSENNTQAYTDFVASALGVASDTPVGQLAGMVGA